MLYNGHDRKVVTIEAYDKQGRKLLYCTHTPEERKDVIVACEANDWDYEPLYVSVAPMHKYIVQIGNIKQVYDSRKIANEIVKSFKLKPNYAHLKVYNSEPVAGQVGIYCYPMPEKHKVLEPKFSTVTARNDKGRVTSVYRRRN